MRKPIKEMDISICKDCIHDNICPKAFASLETAADNCNDFIDRSKVIDLPCEIGARAYYLHKSKKGGGFIQNNLTVVGIHLKDTKGCRGVPRQEYLVVRSDPLNKSTHINLKEVGKTLFFSEEKAEQALKERKND